MKHNVYKTLEKELVINGLVVPVMVQILVEEDQDTDVANDIHFGDTTEDKLAEALYVARFKRGELFCASIGVRATALGEVAFDWLGACHIHSNNYYDSKPFENDVNQAVEDHGMIENALEQLAKDIVLTATALKPFAS